MNFAKVEEIFNLFDTKKHCDSNITTRIKGFGVGLLLIGPPYC